MGAVEMLAISQGLTVGVSLVLLSIFASTISIVADGDVVDSMKLYDPGRSVIGAGAGFLPHFLFAIAVWFSEWSVR